MEGLAGTGHRRALNTVVRRTPRPATSNSTHRCQKQAVPLRAENQAGRPGQHAPVQLIPAVHPGPTVRKVERDNHGVRHVEHNHDANLSNLRFADDILLISGSVDHTTTMPDDLTTASTAQGLQLHEQKTSPTRHEKTEKQQVAAAHAASVDDTADGEPQHPDSEPEKDTTEPNRQDLNEQGEKEPRRWQQPFHRRSAKRRTRRRTEAMVDCIVRASHKADGQLAANGITSWILGQSRIYWKQARMMTKQHEGRWTRLTSNWTPAISTKQNGFWEARKTAWTGTPWKATV